MLSVVIPALNEEDAIEQTVSEVIHTLDSAGYVGFEIIVVNDGSTDKTEAIARATGAKVITHLDNMGYGLSLKDGIKAAENDTIVITDADGTYPINMIPRLLEVYSQGYDMVVGQRKGRHYHESWLKRPLRLILRFIVEFTAGKRIPDINSGLRVFSKNQILEYIDQLCNTFSFTTSATLAYFMSSKYVAYVPIEYHERIGSTKVRIVKDSLRTMQYIVQAILYYNPLKLFILFCAVTMAFAVFAFVVAVLTKLTSAFLLGVGAILVSFIIFSIGLIADQIRQLLIREDARFNKNAQFRVEQSRFSLPEVKASSKADEKRQELTQSEH